MSLLFIYMLHLISCLFNLIAPKTCVICDNRVNHNDTFICEVCNLTLPRTNHILNPYDNNMAKTFWARFPIERAAALFHYETGSKVSKPIQLLKYFNRPDLGEELGRFIAHEFQEQDFFEGISYIIPVPLTKERLKKRGYNQSEMIAKGISKVISIPVRTNVIARKKFATSQTKNDKLERMMNVEDAFLLQNTDQLEGKHILIVDDIVTTGSTIAACGRELGKIKDIKISVLSIGYTKL